MHRVCHAFLSVHCLLTYFGITCLERVNSGVLVQVWCLIVSIPDLCLRTDFVKCKGAYIFFACLTVCSKGKMNFVSFKLLLMLCNPYVFAVLGFVYKRCICLYKYSF